MHRSSRVLPQPCSWQKALTRSIVRRRISAFVAVLSLVMIIQRSSSSRVRACGPPSKTSLSGRMCGAGTKISSARLARPCSTSRSAESRIATLIVEAETTRRSASHSSSVSPLPASARSRDARPGPACAIERTSCFQSMCASVLSREGW